MSGQRPYVQTEKQQRLRPHHAVWHDEILKTKLPLRALKVAGVVASIVNTGDHLFVSHEELARRTRMSRRTCIRAVNADLIPAGWLARTWRGGSGGTGGSSASEYDLTFPAGWWEKEQALLNAWTAERSDEITVTAGVTASDSEHSDSRCHREHGSTVTDRSGTVTTSVTSTVTTGVTPVDPVVDPSSLDHLSGDPSPFRKVIYESDGGGDVEAQSSSAWREARAEIARGHSVIRQLYDLMVGRAA